MFLTKFQSSQSFKRRLLFPLALINIEIIFDREKKGIGT